jgi:hypothetical protein
MKRVSGNGKLKEMKIYQIDGKQYAVIGEELFERLEVTTIDARPTDPLADLPRKKYKSRATKMAKPKKSRGARSITCRICEQQGHFAKTCPKRDGNLPPDEVKRPEVTKEQVDELRAKGYDSLRIAATLKTSLSEVNKHW